MQRRPPGANSPSKRDWTFNIDKRGHRVTTPPERAAIAAWFAGKELEQWYGPRNEVTIDDYEILVVTDVVPHGPGEDEEGSPGETVEEAMERLRAETRVRRGEIAQLAESQFGRKISWGARGGGITRLFSTTTVPVMTRLHIRQRQVLETLVAAGVARNRAEALTWCVELVGRHEKEWIEQLRSAAATLESAREQGPESDRS